jgi:nucleoside-diphosphate-sugar epimerase
VEMIFEEVGRPARVQAPPKIVLRVLGLFNPALRETIEMRYEFDEPFIVDDSDFRRTFGDHATPLEEAIGNTVRWYRDERKTGGVHPAA